MGKDRERDHSNNNNNNNTKKIKRNTFLKGRVTLVEEATKGVKKKVGDKQKRIETCL